MELEALNKSATKNLNQSSLYYNLPTSRKMRDYKPKDCDLFVPINSK